MNNQPPLKEIVSLGLMELTEEDLILVKEQYGEEVYINTIEGQRERIEELRKIKIENVLKRQK